MQTAVSFEGFEGVGVVALPLTACFPGDCLGDGLFKFVMTVALARGARHVPERTNDTTDSAPKTHHPSSTILQGAEKVDLAGGTWVDDEVNFCGRGAEFHVWSRSTVTCSPQTGSCSCDRGRRDLRGTDVRNAAVRVNRTEGAGRLFFRVTITSTYGPSTVTRTSASRR